MNDYLDKNSDIPYYKQLKRILFNKIKNGEFSDGKIWSENEISEKYGISTVTVKRTLQELKHEDVIYKIKGVGSFIKKPKVNMDFSRYLSFGRLIEKEGFKEEIHVINKKEMIIDKDMFESYEIKNPEKRVIYIERLRTVNGKKFVIEELFFNIEVGKKILEQASNNKFIHDFMVDNLKIKFGSIDEYHQPITLDSEKSKVFNVKEGTPTLLVTRVCYDISNKFIDLAKLVLSPDSSVYHLKII